MHLYPLPLPHGDTSTDSNYRNRAFEKISMHFDLFNARHSKISMHFDLLLLIDTNTNFDLVLHIYICTSLHRLRIYVHILMS